MNLLRFLIFLTLPTCLILMEEQQQIQPKQVNQLILSIYWIHSIRHNEHINEYKLNDYLNDYGSSFLIHSLYGVYNNDYNDKNFNCFNAITNNQLPRNIEYEYGTDLYYKLLEYWPSLTTWSEFDFWSYEYRKHASCIIQNNPDGTYGRDILIENGEDYLDAAVNLFLTINSNTNRIKQDLINQRNLYNIVHFSRDYFETIGGFRVVPKCLEWLFLLYLDFCYDRDGTQINCPQEYRTSCGENIQIFNN